MGATNARRRLFRYFKAWVGPDCDPSALDKVQYKRSEQCDWLPDFPKVANAQQASFMLETGIFVEQFCRQITWECTCAIVRGRNLVSAKVRFLLS